MVCKPDDSYFHVKNQQKISVRLELICCFKYAPGDTLNKYHFSIIRHSGESRNLVKTIVYWMPVFTGMTVKILLQSFPSC